MQHTRLTYPGPELRSMPTFAIDCPEGFGPIEAPSTLAAFIESDAPEPFAATIVVGAERIDARISLSDASGQALSDAAASLEGFQLEGERTTVIDGLPAVVRVQSFDEPELGVRLGQVQVMTLLPIMGSGATHDLAYLTGTCLAAELETQSDRFVAAAESLEFFPNGS